MKLLNAILLAALFLGGLSSCSKDDETSAALGTWEGTWGFDFDEPTIYEKWDLNKGGKMVAYNSNGGKMAEGKWEVNGFNFKAEYTTETSHNTYKFEGLYSDAAGEITGNWGAAPSTTNGGTYIMHQQ